MTGLIASLAMYDRPETSRAHDRFWAYLRDALRGMGQNAPQDLTRDIDLMQGWLSPDLIFGQTCSLPFRTKLAGKVTLIATPDYGLDGCPAGHYRSVYVARKVQGATCLKDVAGLRFAYNEALSHSGWAAPFADHQARQLPISARLPTGVHRASAMAVASGRADYAALDALSWALMQDYDDFAATLQVIDHTAPSPALPYITAQGRDAAPLRFALDQAIAALPQADRAVLRLRGVVDLADNAYANLPIPPEPAGH